MEKEVLEKILNFLKEKEGKELPDIWFDLIRKLELIHKLENHPDGTQYIHNGYWDLRNTNIKKMPKDFYTDESLILHGCKQLTQLPDKLHVGRWLDLRNCVKIKKLPDDLHVGGALYLSGCEQLIKLPDNLSVVQLYLDECKKLTELPNNLYVEGKLYLINSSIMDIPNNLYVGDDLFIKNTPLASNYTDEEIYEIVTSKGGEIIGEINR